jgi:hypothetical protein
MTVPIMYGVDFGLTLAFMGGGLLLLTCLWWSYAGDGISVPRERWSGLVRVLGIVGWLLWVSGLLLATLWLFGPVGVATWTS